MPNAARQSQQQRRAAAPEDDDPIVDAEEIDTNSNNFGDPGGYGGGGGGGGRDADSSMPRTYRPQELKKWRQAPTVAENYGRPGEMGKCRGSWSSAGSPSIKGISSGWRATDPADVKQTRE